MVTERVCTKIIERSKREESHGYGDDGDGDGLQTKDV
jgi:hypothetical protein